MGEIGERRVERRSRSFSRRSSVANFCTGNQLTQSDGQYDLVGERTQNHFLIRHCVLVGFPERLASLK